MSHLRTVVRIAREQRMKSILSEPLRNAFESKALPFLWSRGSNNLHSLQILAMPPEELKKGSLPSIVNTMLWSSFLFLFIAMIMFSWVFFLLCLLHYWPLLFYYCCVSNGCNVSFTRSVHCKYWCLGVFPPSIMMKVYRPIPDESCPFCSTAEEKLPKMNIAVPSSLLSEFHFIFDSDVQKLILFFGQTSFSVCLHWGPKSPVIHVIWEIMKRYGIQNLFLCNTVGLFIFFRVIW